MRLFYGAMLLVGLVAATPGPDELDRMTRRTDDCILCHNLTKVGPDRYAYRFTAQGLQIGESCHVYVRDILNTVTDKGRCRVNEDGTIWSVDKGQPLKIVITRPGLTDLFSVYFTFVDGTTIKESIVPRPVDVSNDVGYRMTIQHPMEVDSFFVTGSGFEPLERVRITSISGEESISSTVFAREDGQVTFCDNPAVAGMGGGSFTVRMRGKKGVIEATGLWGEELIHSRCTSAEATDDNTLYNIDELWRVAQGLENVGDMKEDFEAYRGAVLMYYQANQVLSCHPHDQRRHELDEKCRSVFLKMAAGEPHSISEVRIPFETGHLRGLLCYADKEGSSRPLVLLSCPFGCGMEFAYAVVARDLLARGYHCLIYEGPGQGRLLRAPVHTLRRDWNTVITALVTWAEAHTDIDSTQIALWGDSIEGYLIPQALHKEKRIAAAVIVNPSCDLRDGFLEEMDHGLSGSLDAAIATRMQTDAGFRCVAEKLKYALGVQDVTQISDALTPYRHVLNSLEIGCPMLVVGGREDQVNALQKAIKTSFETRSAPTEKTNKEIIDWLDQRIARQCS